MGRREQGINSYFGRLAAINRAITTSLNFNETLRLIVDNAAELFLADNCLLLMAEDDGILRVRAAHAPSEAISQFAGPMEESLIRNLSKVLELDPGTLVTVPVVAHGSVTGFLAIVRNSELNSEEEWQLSALADQAAIALNNARLHEFQTGEAIRQRDESLAALRESNSKISKILESITDLYYQLDREYRFVDINRVTQERFGKSRDELLGKVIWEVFPSAVESELYPQFHQALETQKPVHFELASKIVAGVWFEAHAYPTKTGLTVYLKDITERRTAELTQNLLASIVESSGDAIASKNLDGIFSSWNKGAEQVFGYTAEEAIGRPVTMLIPEDHIDEEPSILARLRRGERIEHYETVRRRKDGSLIDVSLTVSPIRDEKGNIIGGSKIARDITERKQGEKRIAFQAHLLDAVEQAVIASDINGTVIFWNSFAERLYGWSESEALGANILDLTPSPEAREQAEEIMARLAEGKSWSGEMTVRRRDGTVFSAMITDSPIVGEAGELIGVVGVSVDITERKKAEAEREQLHESERAARAEAEKANRLKDEFLATLSHELRNPLNVILGYAEVLLRSDEAQASDFVRKAAEILKRNALAQSRLVRDLLDLSRLHIGKLSLNTEVVSLETIIDNAIETVSGDAAAKHIQLKVEKPEDIIFVNADPLRLEQVIWNLLNNAVKFTPDGGRVNASWRSQDGILSLVVEDNGPGIEPEFLPHVFEMFRQADASSSRTHGGMGIGLALVKQLIELHGGRVSVASTPGQGARFTIEMPVTREAEPTSEYNPHHEQGLLGGLKILVVDDSRDTTEMLQRLFEMDDAQVTTASSGAEAIAIARQQTFDVVLSDISMPGMDGFEFVRLLRQIPQHQQVPVLALTGFGRAEDVERARAEGFLTHVTKPIDVNSLIETLRKLPSTQKASV